MPFLPHRNNADLRQIEEEQDERGADRLLFSQLTLLAKLCKHVSLLELSKPAETLRHIWSKTEPPRLRLGLLHKC